MRILRSVWTKWLTATWPVSNCKSGASGCEIARALNVTPKTAWFLDHRIRVSLGMSTVLSSSTNLRDEVQALAAQWREETGHLSSIERKALHPAYQRIIAMGLAGVPHVLDELAIRKGHWFGALHSMTGEDQAERATNVGEARAAWLLWGEREGYLKGNVR